MLSQCKPCNSICEENLYPRLFLCGRCRQQVRICSRCDRGQVYCGGGCALEVRRSKQREARVACDRAAPGYSIAPLLPAG
jgi:hypothetical protein